jgi:hypothetical protein
VHSLREGFGRCLVEGRLAGLRVICMDIPEFAWLRDGDVYLYRNADEFMTTLKELMHMDATVGRYRAYPYPELLRSAIRQGFAAVKSARGTPQSRPAR